MASRRCLALLALALTSGAEDTSSGHLRGPPKEDVPGLPEMAGASRLPDTAGPYHEVPSDADAEKPKPAMQDWRSKVPNPTQGSLGSLVSLQDWQEHQFCNVHQTGFFCDGLTRIRCCKLEDGYAKCGSTANSSACGGQEAESPKQKALCTSWCCRWHVWPCGGYGHESSFCRAHHVGSFCSSHRITHCCNEDGHFVNCTSSYSDGGRWC